ncbi:MAG: FHA domain-containing protein, partial [Bdellovibrionales bacterium]|nr:FHA domain-containing protein [Bdellovibrionales bacterium]
MSIQLTVMSLDFDSSGTPITKTYNKKEITLGRYPENDVVLDKPEVSGVHARLRVQEVDSGQDPVLYITDLGSSNGTLVENNSLAAQTEIEMHPNERIIIGNYLIKPTVFKGPIEDFTQAKPIDADQESIGFGQDDEVLLDDLPDESDLSEEGLYAVPAAGSFEEIAGEPELVPEQNGLDAGGFAYSPQSHSLFESEGEAMTDLKEAPNELEAAMPNIESSVDVPAPHPLTASIESSAEAVTVRVDGFSVNDINFDATALYSVSGAITHKGRALSGVAVDGGALGSATTDADGRYLFSNVPEGTPYTISAKHEGFLLDCRDGSGEVRGDVAVPFTATQLFQIAGTVTHKGNPLAGASIDGGELGARTTDENGKFVFAGVPEFTHYRISVSREGYIFDGAVGAGQVGSSDESLTFTARKLFTISGRVTHHGIPLEGVEVDGGE